FFNLPISFETPETKKLVTNYGYLPRDPTFVSVSRKKTNIFAWPAESPSSAAAALTGLIISIFSGHLSQQERDHDQGENQKLSLYQAFIIPRPKLLPGLHVQSTYGYSKKWFFLSVWSHAQLTLASHCVINSYVVTMQPVSAMCDWQVWAYLQICSLHELLFFFLKLQPDAPSSSSSDENAQSFTLRAPRKLKTTTQVVALNRCC
ncbi:hypothetical protein HID58_005961, partial [Brassica napus]